MDTFTTNARLDGAEVLEPDTILPVQWHNGRAIPTRALAAAIFEEAVHTFTKERHAMHLVGRGPRWFQMGGNRDWWQAVGWLFARGDLWPFSCESICTVLDWEPDYIRASLVKLWHRLQEADRRGEEAGCSD